MIGDHCQSTDIIITDIWLCWSRLYHCRCVVWMCVVIGVESYGLLVFMMSTNYMWPLRLVEW